MSGNSLKNNLAKVLKEATELIQNTSNLSDLEKIRVQFLGKKSLLIKLMKSLSSLDPSEKAAAGKDLNKAKVKINSLLANKKSSLENNSQSKVNDKTKGFYFEETDILLSKIYYS